MADSSTQVWRDLMVAMAHDDVDEDPVEYAAKRHDERFGGPSP